ncbi:hypothetical protein CAPTEDRAFT_201158 [Capitella teleta]|uniref:Uncharacterized protein n=1 Tax=Capitella teleta TaxID=283909 RepID=R7VB37_CAPTE|nr:hypothetical protein CAPTEDRAFT_201158 [Capitella teleta]|eukprot:ELU15737.1 hypothetical protein CAPTEDRAFT_201158 [Capitella teleta]
MAATGKVKGWKRLLEENPCLPVAYDRQDGAGAISTPFCLTLRTVEGIQPKVSVLNQVTPLQAADQLRAACHMNGQVQPCALIPCLFEANKFNKIYNGSGDIPPMKP